MTRKTSRLLAMERRKADLESCGERRPLIFRAVLLALPVSMLLWWLFLGMVR